MTHKGLAIELELVLMSDKPPEFLRPVLIQFNYVRQGHEHRLAIILSEVASVTNESMVHYARINHAELQSYNVDRLQRVKKWVTRVVKKPVYIKQEEEPTLHPPTPTEMSLYVSSLYENGFVISLEYSSHDIKCYWGRFPRYQHRATLGIIDGVVVVGCSKPLSDAFIIVLNFYQGYLGVEVSVAAKAQSIVELGFPRFPKAMRAPGRISRSLPSGASISVSVKRRTEEGRLKYVVEVRF
jgi:hypothetical protein